jgi:PHD/YefM family antitoxin component YafN of YafNO toxin-antitoxin module
MNKSGLVATVTVVIFVIAVIWVQAVPLEQNGLFNDLTARRVFAQFLQVTAPQGQGRLDANFINADVVNVTTGTGTLTSNKISAGTVDANSMDVKQKLTANVISGNTIGASELQARAFELLDQQSKVRASLKITADNQPELVLLDKNGKARIRLTIDKDNNAVVSLLDQNGQPRSINP